ncbi:MAG: BrnA antitoxin family protein [Tepidisphaeraceae bacterium]
MSTKHKAVKPIPAFATEDAERAFWAKEDVSEYFDWSLPAQPRLPALKPSTVSISIRLPITLLEELKALANARDVPYQSLMKILLAEKVAQARRG